MIQTALELLALATLACGVLLALAVLAAFLLVLIKWRVL